jgi:hypothetical protein
MGNFYRILAYEVTFFISSTIFILFTDYKTFDKTDTLSTMISVISIILAIIITYLFSKLFSEKTIKVERKKEIDELSKKITYFRRIAFHIRGMHEFWKFKEANIKSAVDHKYPELTYEQFRSYPGHEIFNYEELDEIDKKIYGTCGQAYLALKGLEDNDNSFSFFVEFNPQNYSLDDIERYKDYSSSFWYLLDRSDKAIVNFNGVSKYSLKFIDELYFKITRTNINKEDYRGSIKELFSHYDSEIFEKHYYLTKLNSDNFPSVFKNSFINMLVFLILLIVSLFLYVIDFNVKLNFLSSIFLLSLFISNTIDLILITFQSIKSDLNVTDIYKL